jgi:hypothetical protein
MAGSGRKKIAKNEKMSFFEIPALRDQKQDSLHFFFQLLYYFRVSSSGIVV